MKKLLENSRFSTQLIAAINYGGVSLYCCILNPLVYYHRQMKGSEKKWENLKLHRYDYGFFFLNEFLNNDKNCWELGL